MNSSSKHLNFFRKTKDIETHLKHLNSSMNNSLRMSDLKKGSIVNFSLILALCHGVMNFSQAQENQEDKNQRIKKSNKANEKAYDEYYLSNGEIRSEYAGIWNIYSRFDTKAKDEFIKLSKKDFQGDNALLSLPRVMTEKEYQFLANGVAQRGRALQAFLKDHYSGQKNYLKAKLIPAEVLKNIIDRSFENEVQLGNSPIEFLYGPDIIRDPSGQFRVVEDNTGFVGGLGDLNLARESLFKRIPEYKTFAKKGYEPEIFYQEFAAQLKTNAQKHKGIPLIINYTSALSADNEDKRVRQIFAEQGIETFNLDPSQDYSNKQLRLSTDKNGLYLEYYNLKGKLQSKEKVGYVMININSEHIEPLHPFTSKRFLFNSLKYFEDDENLSQQYKKRIQSALTLKNSKGELNYSSIKTLLDKLNTKFDFDLNKTNKGIPGFWELIKNKKLGCLNAAGSEFVNDKQFYIYVENLVRFYLKEEPILKNIETFPAAIPDQNEKLVINTEGITRLRQNISEYVIKGVNGRGGDAVWIGHKMSEQELDNVIAKIESNPSMYIIQKFTPLSQMDGNIVDLRLHASMTEASVVVAKAPWGRSIPLSGNGKVNISDQGRETTQFVIKRLKKAKCLSLIK